MTDDEIEALAKKHIAPHADRLAKILPHRPPYQQTEQFRRVKALIADVLSKLRAPVAYERAAFNKWAESLGYELGTPTVGLMLAGWNARAALASAPVAAKRQNVCVHFSKIGSVGPFPVDEGWVMIPDATMQDLACRMAIHESGRAASAPVAGEAQPVAWANEDGDPISDAMKRARLDLYGKHYTRPLYAAPQASKPWPVEEQPDGTITSVDPVDVASAPVAVLSDADIREVFLAHGFTIKDGQADLKPYVYEAARALIAVARIAADADKALGVYAARESAPVANAMPIRLSTDVLEYLKEGIENATGCDDSDVDHDFANELERLMTGPLYTKPLANYPEVEWAPMVVAPVAGEAAYYAVMHGNALYGIFDSEAAAEASKEQGHPDAPFSVKPLYAAPQASEAVRNTQADKDGAPHNSDSRYASKSSTCGDCAKGAGDVAQRLRDNAELDAAEGGNPQVIALELEAAAEIDRLRAALSPEPAQGWQPIETAPKGEVMLLFGGLKKDGKVYAPHVNVGYWTEKFGWTCLVYAHQDFAHIEPTHWMPRPPFPTQPTGGRDEA